MDVRLLLLLLLCCSTAEASWDVVSERIRASAGAAVVLPCSISATDDLPTLEWSKQHLHPDIVLLYRSGFEIHEEKNPAFEHRTSLFMRQLRHGNVSLRISDVQLSDAGKYNCKTIMNGVQTSTVIELSVGAVSEPRLSEVPAVDGGVTLQCDADCWYPKPEITFLDIHGNEMFAETQKSFPESRGCFAVSRRVKVEPAHPNSVVCRVHQPDINETRTVELYRSGVCPTCTTVTIVLSVLLVLCGLGICVVCLYKKYGNSEVFRNLFGCTTTEEPKAAQAAGADAAQLQEELRRKEETIRRLTGEVEELRSKRAGVVCQHDQPTIDCSPSRSSNPVSLPAERLEPKAAASRKKSNRPKPGNLPENKDSKPAVSGHISASDPAITARDLRRPGSAPPASAPPASAPPASAATADHSPVVRTKSLSGPPQRSARPQRRYSTCLAGNPFLALDNLSEEMEQLLQ